MNQLHDYAAAHFNLLLGGNIVNGCQVNNTMPTPGTATEAFECLAKQLPKMEAVGVKFAWGVGHYNQTDGVAARVFGGAASYGGVSESGPGASVRPSPLI
jgi:hypothetical protein